MAIIYSYPQIGELATGDTIAISDASNGNKTKSVTIGQLDSYINTGQATIIQVDDRVVTGASFNTGSGLLTLTRNGGDIPSVTTNLDGRYYLSSNPNSYTSNLGVVQSLTTNFTSGAATLVGGVLNIPQYSGGGGGGITEITTTAPITGGTITTTGTIGITQASGSADGYLSSTDWNTFNSKSTFDGQFSSLSNKPTTIAGYGITDALQLGVTATTALAGNTTTITNTQATAIVTNSGKTSFPGFGTTAGTALEGNTVIPSSTSDLTNDSGFVEGTTSTQTAITEIKTLTSAEYAAITPSADVMYVIV